METAPTAGMGNDRRSPTLIGRTLTHYRITAAIGAGGMGEVYRATDTKLGREVALKVLPAEMASSPERLERFRREARAVAALNHPHIVTIYSVEEEGGVHFLTMELVEGQPLDHLIAGGGLPRERFLEIAAALAEALAAAHDKSIVHRDLKPANIMVGSDGRVKVLDFGLARMRGPQAEESTGSQLPTDLHTREGAVMGTAPYMSPEQVSGLEVDHRTDIFSLGVVLHEMATGTRPFQGPSAAALLSAILRDPPPAVADVRPDLPRELDWLISRCLEKDRNLRTQSAREVRDELAAAAPAELRHASPVRCAGCLGRRGRKRRGRRRIESALHRRPPVRQLEPRRGQRVLQRRAHRGDHRGPVKGPGAARHLPNVGDAAQGREEGRAGDRPRPRRALRSRGQRIVVSDPLASVSWMLSGATRWFVGRFDEALPDLERGLELDPQSFVLRWCAGYTCAALGRFPEAARHAALLREIGPDVPYTRQLLALLDGLEGRKEAALERLASLDVAPLDAHNKFHLAESFGLGGDVDRAMDVLAQAVDGGFYPYPFMAEHCPFLAPLRFLPRFTAILAKAQERSEAFRRSETESALSRRIEGTR